MPKRRLLILTQALMAIPPLVLFGLSVTDNVAAWMVMALVLARGIVLAVDLPARQSYVIEIVGTDKVVSAVGLQSVLIHTSRITGPAIAGVLIAGGSIELCFLLNALSFGGMILALRSLDRSALAPPKLAAREPGAIRKGFQLRDPHARAGDPDGDDGRDRDAGAQLPRPPAPPRPRVLRRRARRATRRS